MSSCLNESIKSHLHTLRHNLWLASKRVAIFGRHVMVCESFFIYLLSSSSKKGYVCDSKPFRGVKVVQIDAPHLSSSSSRGWGPPRAREESSGEVAVATKAASLLCSVESKHLLVSIARLGLTLHSSVIIYKEEDVELLLLLQCLHRENMLVVVYILS